MVIVLCVALVALRWGLRHRLNRVLLSPLTIVTAAFAGMGVVGAKVYAAVQYAPLGGSARIILDDAQTEQTLRLFVLAALCVLLGGGAVLLAARRPARAVGVSWHVAVPPGMRYPTLVATTLPMAAVWLAIGPANLMWRGRYLEAHVQSTPLLSLAVPLSLAACLVLGSLMAAGSMGLAVLAGGVTLGYEVTYFAVGSRVLAMVPLLVAVGWSLGRAGRRRGRGGLVWGTLLSAVMLPIPLYLRGQSAHGVWPYLAAMHAYSAQSVGFDSMLRNVFISFGLVGATAFTAGPMPWHTFVVSVNPLPGGMAGWYELAGTERLNIYTPYAAMGEVGNHGTLAVILFYLCVGGLLGWLELRVRAHLHQGQALLALVPSALSALYVLSNYQYNLRTSCRVLLYALIVEAVLLVVGRRRQRSPSDDARERAVRHVAEMDVERPQVNVALTRTGG